MEKKHPVFIEQLSKDIEIARDLQRKALDDAKHYGDLVYKLSIEREKQCPHKYADGKSAWKDYYAYGACDICGYSDL